MIGEVSDANPDMDPTTISVRLNGIIRKVYDRRPWYGLMVRGQIPCVGQVVGGTVNITNGSPTVIGTGTNWTAAIINRQFRIGYNTDRYTITAVQLVPVPMTVGEPLVMLTVPPTTWPTPGICPRTIRPYHGRRS